MPSEIVGGVGWLSRIRVSRPASSVIGGLLVLGGLLYLLYGRVRYGLPHWNCTTNEIIFGFL